MSRPTGKINKAAQDEITRIPPGIDLTTFFAPHIPDDVRAAFLLFHEYPSDLITGLTKLMVKYLSVGDTFSLPPKLYSSEVSQEHLNLLMTAIYIILKQAIRTKSKISVVRADLTAMKMPASFVETVCNELCEARMNLESVAVTNRLHFAHLEKLRWRIDVIISSGSLSRIMRPSILMQVQCVRHTFFRIVTSGHYIYYPFHVHWQMVTKDGSIRTFEVSIEQFNQLRYNVAKVGLIISSSVILDCISFPHTQKCGGVLILRLLCSLLIRTCAGVARHADAGKAPHH